ncbi:hypothetical protein C7999DRAFT_11293 [Corynascus novoguineensis]|uniref:Uncharacterized protein n=1 Tax=Corynascus novoguineensis TaxID=1126955 RepID=A0AAN7HTU3_9PEZI|nr:hypothetical protein C7999DRAFT_11293 [Corynascus novoguineensis]
MASSMTDDVPRFARTGVESLSAEDFETASVRSIRSAAPSYTSDAPSYHSTNPHPEPLPAYSPPARTTSAQSAATATTTTRTAAAPRNGSVSSLLDLVEPSTTSSSSSTSSTPRRYGLPPVPTGPPRPPPAELPSLAHFRASSSWLDSGSSSASFSNPNARIYHNVALRRASAASNGGGGRGSGSRSHLDGAMLRRVMLERIDEEERNSHLSRVRPLEDPYLVGEEAAARARAQRLARERSLGDEVLIREDRRWDWFLAQMKDREERERSWKRFRKDVEKRSTSRLPFRIGARF